ncbi:hypothetical protein Q4Q39_05050 [Flavivirga amylovorans]|uniref:DUF3244 domain-containing protein n=1 Tax=Flavivirga amylovorans TaxID=870486 RepID=A0ABT8WZJ0_9FLAO|nr:hypothetical protein [Flavivirga amylovorans]MDO5986770.1 hypothetical protein [Flavivirga amylovorans]
MKKKVITIVFITSMFFVYAANPGNTALMKKIMIDLYAAKDIVLVEQNETLLTPTVGVRSVYPGTNDKLTKILIYKKNPFAFYDEIDQSEIDPNAFPLFYIDTSNWPSGDYHLVMFYEGNQVLHDDITI